MPGPEQDLVARDLVNKVRLEITFLPKVYREPLVLRYVDELPIAEVADRLGVTVTALKSRMFRAQAELRRRLLSPARPARTSRGAYEPCVP